MTHKFFSSINWQDVLQKKVEATKTNPDIHRSVFKMLQINSHLFISSAAHPSFQATSDLRDGHALLWRRVHCTDHHCHASWPMWVPQFLRLHASAHETRSSACEIAFLLTSLSLKNNSVAWETTQLFNTAVGFLTLLQVWNVITEIYHTFRTIKE